MDKPWTNYWQHICLDVDITAKTLTSSVNGRKNVTVDVEDMLTNKPDFLENKLVLGITEDPVKGPLQFHGSVVNINIHHNITGKSVEKMSANPCQFSASGDFMAWSDVAWEKTGDNVREMEMEDKTVCDKNKTVNVPLAGKMKWHDAKQTCEKLGHGNITETNNEIYLLTFVDWFETNKDCTDIWTPFTDEEDEGVYINSNNGNVVDYLPWMAGQPNGGSLQNYIAIYIIKHIPMFLDDPDKSTHCVSCSVDVLTMFTLWGRCEDTYLGRKKVI